jgi:hypothetical protein
MTDVDHSAATAAANCTTCIAYLDARLGVLMEHLVAKATRDATALVDALASYMGKVHRRHTSGRALDVPGYTWLVYSTPDEPVRWVLRPTGKAA